MPLIKCKDCNNDISNKAAICIHCGCPIAENKKTGIYNMLSNVYKNKPESLTELMMFVGALALVLFSILLLFLMSLFK